MIHSAPPLFSVLLVFTVVLHLASLADCLPVQATSDDITSTGATSVTDWSSDLEDAALYRDLEDILDHSELSNLAVESASLEELPLPRPHFFRHAPTDTPSLTDLLRSAVRTEFKQLGGRKPIPSSKGEQLWKRNRGGVLLKRSFDSISRSSGFGGMHRGSWGGMNRNGENLTFTFESLFPAIARGLRSAK